MKFLFTAIVLLAAVIPSLGQDKAQRYCVVEITPKYYSPFVSARILPWEGMELFSLKDSSGINNLNLITKYRTVPDALNYMASMGWSLVTIGLPYRGRGHWYYFRKEFDRSELVNP